MNYNKKAFQIVVNSIRCSRRNDAVGLKLKYHTRNL